MPITPLPAPPLRSDGPATFADKGDAFMAALPAFVTEANALEANVNTKEASAVASAAAAAASQVAAAASSGATKWVSGTTYAIGDVRWSPANSQSYRRKTAGAGTTDPASDSTNWAQIAGVPVQTGHAGKVLRTDGTNATWGAPISVVAYDNRATVRAIAPEVGASLVIDGLGLFTWESGSTELDDDETCFATASGRWLLTGASPEYVMAVLMQGDDELWLDVGTLQTDVGTLQAKFLSGTFSMNATSLATITSTSFTATVTGAAVGDRVVVNPGDSFGNTAADQGKLHYVAYVSAANTVTVTIRNASASTANMTASTWAVTVIKP